MRAYRYTGVCAWIKKPRECVLEKGKGHKKRGEEKEKRKKKRRKRERERREGEKKSSLWGSEERRIGKREIVIRWRLGFLLLLCDSACVCRGGEGRRGGHSKTHSMRLFACYQAAKTCYYRSSHFNSAAALASVSIREFDLRHQFRF